MRTFSPSRYMISLAATVLIVLAAAWAYVVSFPMAFLPSGYAVWMAKQALIRNCNIGTIGFAGDSRLEAGVIPAALPVGAINVGMAGASPIEVETAVRHFLRCDRKPGQVVIALGAAAFGEMGELFWYDTLRYGFIEPEELLTLERRATALDDWPTLDSVVTSDGLKGRVRDWLYAVRFPPLFFGNLTQGRFFRRYGDNRAQYDRVVRARGYVPYPPAPPDDHPGQDTKMPRFDQPRLKAAYMDSALTELGGAGVRAAFLMMPVKAATQAAIRPEVAAAYVGNFRAMAARFPNVQVIGGHIPVWPNDMFVDTDHLSPEGARKFTALLAACVVDGAIRSDCDLDWTASLAQTGRAPAARTP